MSAIAARSIGTFDSILGDQTLPNIGIVTILTDLKRLYGQQPQMSQYLSGIVCLDLAQVRKIALYFGS